MKIKVFHTLTSLIFCAVSLCLLAESAQYGFLSSLGLSLLLGLVLRRPVIRLNEWFEHRLERTRLM